jgi:hypothetical protein
MDRRIVRAKASDRSVNVASNKATRIGVTAADSLQSIPKLDAATATDSGPGHRRTLQPLVV